MKDQSVLDRYSRLLDKVYPDRTKCKCCGKDIFYSDTKIEEKQNGFIKVSGKSFETDKEVEGIVYNLQVCEECLLNKFPNIKNLSRTFNVMSEQTKFAFDIPDDVYIRSRSRYAMTLEKMISKYGDVEGRTRWKKYCERQSETNTFAYKKEKYGWTEEDFNKYNKSRAITKKNLIAKYGEEEGTKRFEHYVSEQHRTKSWDYMVEKFGEEKARQINRSKVVSLEKYISMYGKDAGERKWYEFISNRTCGYSKQSQQIFRRLDSILCPKYTTRFATKNGEYCVDFNGVDIHMDYYIEELNICIEFNGGCFHGDPRLFEDDCRCNPFDPSKTAKELREKDERRYKLLLDEFGIKTFVIWELDVENGDFNEYDFITKDLEIEI